MQEKKDTGNDVQCPHCTLLPSGSDPTPVRKHPDFSTRTKQRTVMSHAHNFIEIVNYIRFSLAYDKRSFLSLKVFFKEDLGSGVK